MIGKRFGRLVVVSEVAERTPDRRIQFKCQCDCGGSWITAGRNLLKGTTRSCGCLSGEVRAALNKETKTKLVEGTPTRYHPLYKTYIGMRTRCYNPNHHAYGDYGGRGIDVCSRWLESFLDFVEDMGPRPEGYTLDRKDNDKGYSPENCRWATPREQSRNKRPNRGWRKKRERNLSF